MRICISELDQFNLFLPTVFRKTMGTLGMRVYFPRGTQAFFAV